MALLQNLQPPGLLFSCPVPAGWASSSLAGKQVIRGFSAPVAAILGCPLIPAAEVLGLPWTWEPADIIFFCIEHRRTPVLLPLSFIHTGANVILRVCSVVDDPNVG